MAKEEIKQIKHTQLNIKERNRIILNGILNVESFDESYVTLETSEGRICIEGQGLKIESLSQNGGEIQIAGRINGVFYTKDKKAKGAFSRLFG